MGFFMFFHLQSENKVIIHVNNEQSKNCLSNRGLTVFAVEVAPKSMTVRFFLFSQFKIWAKSKNHVTFSQVIFCKSFVMIKSMWIVEKSVFITSTDQIQLLILQSCRHVWCIHASQCRLLYAAVQFFIHVLNWNRHMCHLLILFNIIFLRLYFFFLNQF